MTRTAKACGPDVAVLASMLLGTFDFPGHYGGKRAVLRGEHAISRKAIAQGMSGVLRCPVCSCAHFLVHVAHETAGAARIRHSLRPLNTEGETICKTSGKSCRENAKLRLAAGQTANTAVVPGLTSDAQLRIGGPILRGPSVRAPALVTFQNNN